MHPWSNRPAMELGPTQVTQANAVPRWARRSPQREPHTSAGGLRARRRRHCGARTLRRPVRAASLRRQVILYSVRHVTTYRHDAASDVRNPGRPRTRRTDHRAPTSQRERKARIPNSKRSRTCFMSPHSPAFAAPFLPSRRHPDRRTRCSPRALAGFPAASASRRPQSISVRSRACG